MLFKPTSKPSERKRRTRRQVEIYFVLYLAALLLLLPTKRERAPESDPSLVYELLKSRFIIAAERPTMNCQLLVIGDSVRIVTLDSVNTVSSSGDVGDVHYEFRVEDETQGQVLTISSQTPQVGIFMMKEDTQRKLAEFFWQPARNEKRSRTLKVSVIGTAKPVIPSTITRPDIRERLLRLLNEEDRFDTARTEFTINISFLDVGRSIALNNINIDSLISAVRSSSASLASGFSQPIFVTNRQFVQPPPGEFSLYAATERVECLPYQEWENQIRVYGMNLRTEGRGDPKTEILRTDINDGSGSASIAEVRGDFIRVIGKAPASGLMTIRVVVIRAGDGKQNTIDFPVRAIPIAAPNIPRRMYAGVAYEFDPKLPFVTKQELRATLSLGGKERSISQQGEKFTFAPDESDIGKTFLFERFVGGKRVGEVYYVKVEEFSAPEIYEVFSQGADEFVRTRCYGQVNGNDNRVTLEVKGNLKVSERNGDYRKNEKDNTVLQLFKISKADASKAYNGTIRAIDSKGRASIARFINRED